jgi:hypothetical protein
MSLDGTNQTTSDVRLESAFGGRAEVGFRIPGASVDQPTEPLLGTLSVYCEHDERVLDAIWRGER